MKTLRLVFWFNPVLLVPLAASSCSSPSSTGYGGACDFSSGKSGATFAAHPKHGNIPSEIYATAHQLVPGFEIEETEREKENGKIMYSLRGIAQGREVELEIAEDQIVGR